MREWRKRHPGRAYAQWKASRRRHPETRQRQTARNYERGKAHLTLAERATRRPWTAEEDKLVFPQTMLDRDLAIKIRRGVRAIQLRRSKLRKGLAA
jgi:hypothetical protein